MKALIINADDLGLCEDINEGVKSCLRAGAVTAASIAGCGPAFGDAAEMLLSEGINEAGAHLTITGGMVPCQRDKAKIRSLLCPNGCFPAGYADIAKRLVSRGIDISEVNEEFRAQIRKIRDAGIRVTHLDAHEHVHMFPGILRTTLDLAVECGIPYVRVPLESFRSVRSGFRPRDLFRYCGLRYFSGRGIKAVKRRGIAHNHRFLGHFHSGRLDNVVMEHLLETLEDGITELAVHPGMITEDLLKASPWHKNAGKEIEFLTHGEWRDKIESLGIKLVTHAEALKMSLQG